MEFKQKPRVSVIVPCYNVEKFLARCLDSLVNQTLRDIEIICIDDASTDGTLEILAKYARQDARITIIAHDRNTGVAVARNDGMKVAMGQYSGFVDPDDYVDLDFYEKLYAAACKTCADVVHGGVRHTDATTGNVAKDDMAPRANDIVNFSWGFWAAIYRTNFLCDNEINFPPAVITAQDAVFLTRVALAARSIVLVPDTMYNYFYRRPGSLDSLVLSHAKAVSKYTAFSMNLKFIEAAKLTTKRRNKFIRIHVLDHVRYELKKQFDNIADKEKLFSLPVDIHERYGMRKEFISMFGRRGAKCIFLNDFMKFSVRNLPKHRIYLFGLVPFVMTLKTNDITAVYLFDIMPLLRIKKRRWCYLFGFIPVLKIRGTHG